MATVSFTQFLPEVLPLAVGCADVVAVNAIRNAAIEFCTQSHYWQETQDAVTVPVADLPYSYEPPNGATIVALLGVYVDGVRVDSITLDELDAAASNWRSDTATSVQRYFHPNPDQLAFYPVPEQSVSLQVRVAYAPSRAATGIEGYVYQKYLETIASGALGRLLAQPGLPYTNTALADFHAAKFQRGIVEAANAAARSHNRAGLAVQMRAFA